MSITCTTNSNAHIDNIFHSFIRITGRFLSKDLIGFCSRFVYSEVEIPEPEDTIKSRSHISCGSNFYLLLALKSSFSLYPVFNTYMK